MAQQKRTVQLLSCLNGVIFTTTADGSRNWIADTETATPTAGDPFTALTSGTYDVAVTSTDAGGNSTGESTSSDSTIDTTAPVAPTVVSQTTNDTTPVLSGTAEASALLQ